MKDNCFTVLCWFLPYIHMNQPQVYVCPLSLESPSRLLPHPTPLGCHRAPIWIPWVPLAVYFTYGNVYVSPLLSPSFRSVLPLHPCVRTPILCVWRQILNHWTPKEVPGSLTFEFGVGLSLVSGSPSSCTDQFVLSCVLGEGRWQKTRCSAPFILLPCPVNSPDPKLSSLNSGRPPGPSSVPAAWVTAWKVSLCLFSVVHRSLSYIAWWPMAPHLGWKWKTNEKDF